MAVSIVHDQNNRRLAGICAGLAVYTNMGVGLVRRLTVILGVLTGSTRLRVMIFDLPEGVPMSKEAEWKAV
jgi:phage shock protein PspC (stress-responsive transcriptional regulator)